MITYYDNSHHHHGHHHHHSNVHGPGNNHDNDNNTNIINVNQNIHTTSIIVISTNVIDIPVVNNKVPQPFSSDYGPPHIRVCRPTVRSLKLRAWPPSANRVGFRV